jgi:iron(III) transport system ATP-binding protein
MRLETALYLGERWEYLLTRGALHVRAWGRAPLSPGECWVEFSPDDLWLFRSHPVS